MTNKQELYALADKVEKLEGGCRETDALITIALKLTNGQCWFWDNFNEWQSSKAGNVYTYSNGMRGSWFEAQKLTSSIDAAMTLVPDGLTWMFNYDPKQGGAQTSIFKEGDGCIGSTTSKTLPNAIVAAALRAQGDSYEK